MTKKKENYDYIVIGAGSGGLVVAVGLLKMGKDVAVISENIGGDCTHVGCVPSKTFLYLAKKYRLLNTEDQRTELKSNVFNLIKEKVNSFIADEIDLIPEDRYFNGRAKFISKDTVKYTNGTDEQAFMFEKKCIIATGSKPRILKIDGLSENRILSNEQIFSLEKMPKSITIIGGGPIGAEMATAFASFGVKTYVVSKKYLAREPIEISKRSLESLIKLGVEFHSAHVDKFKDGELYLDNGKSIPETEIYLGAIGRISNTNLDLEKAGIKYDKSGIETNQNQITSNKNVYAIGDVGQNPQFTHLAANHAKFVLKKLSFPLARKNKRALPRVTFTNPTIASVGNLKPDDSCKLFKLNFTDTDRGRTNYNEDSYGEVLIDLRSGRVKGASLFGDFSEELINLFTLMIDEKIPITNMTEFITPYPTYANIFDRLTVDYIGYLSKNWKKYPFGSGRQMFTYLFG